MQYTSNYNLLLPEGTDTVNLLTQMNPNTSDIDAAMFANKQAVVGRASELTAGTVHAITRSNTDSPVFAFTATSNWTAGDSMSVDGVAVSVYLPDGTTPATGAYVINSEVLAIIQGSRVTLFTPSAAAAVTPASDVTYDNTGSGLTATNAQDAIDEIAGGFTYYNTSTAGVQISLPSEYRELYIIAGRSSNQYGDMGVAQIPKAALNPSGNTDLTIMFGTGVAASSSYVFQGKVTITNAAYINLTTMEAIYSNGTKTDASSTSNIWVYYK